MADANLRQLACRCTRLEWKWGAPRPDGTYETSVHWLVAFRCPIHGSGK